MITALFSGVNAAIGGRLLKNKNQLVFTEYSSGHLSMLDLVRPLDSVISTGITILKGTWVFDCETGNLGGGLGGPGDIWWEQVDTVQRKMVPVGGASILNLGKVDYASLTPALLQALPFSPTPIPGSNDASNQLKANHVFAVRTKAGHLCKIRVITYGYNLKIEWTTYKLANPLHRIGAGYTTPEDIAVCTDEKTAYVTERNGHFLRVDLTHANRTSATVLASGLNAPQQICLDELHQQAYLVEYANPGRLLRIDLATGAATVLLPGLNQAIGLLISPDLAYAYISEQSGGGRITRYSLQGQTPLVLASGLTNPFFLAWADPARTAMYVTERDPANRLTLVETVPHSGSVRHLAGPTGSRPSCAIPLDASRVFICCDQEIDQIDLLAGLIPAGLFMGIGQVPWNLITPGGRADTTTQPAYPYQFTKDAPFAGVLSLQINHLLAWLSSVRYYRILINGIPRLETWWDLKLNGVNGKYEIPEQFKPKTIGGQPGYYAIHTPGDWYMNSNLGMILNSSALPNGLTNFLIEFTTATGGVLQTHNQPVYLDNQAGQAAIEMPTVDGVAATTNCGMLQFSSKTQKVRIVYTASQPWLNATYSWRLGRAGKGPVPGVASCSVDGPVSLNPFLFEETVGTLLGTCPSAAFYAHVYVYAKAINGTSRQSQYDASATVAFALMP